MPLTWNVKSVFEATVAEAAARGDVRIAAAHLLLGILRVPRSTAATALAAVLAERDTTPADLRESLVAGLDSGPAGSAGSG